jgi:8-oxo-dGTP pyrophosphatase MutT (NUDIX family)
LSDGADRAAGAGLWPALAQARGDASGRLPFLLAGRRVGSIDPAQRPALAALCGGDPRWRLGDAAIELLGVERADEALAVVNAALRATGLVRAWRDEPYPVFDTAGPGRELVALARQERAASRFWGTLTLGAHANGWVAGDDGRPAGLWIAQRAFDKATDPGALDNLVGGGVPAGQDPWQTLLREGWEEAGLPAARMARAQPGRVVALDRAIPEGWQHEWLYVYDLALAPGEQPLNQDGEVASFRCLPVAEAIALARDGPMTVDASLVTLDFALRHRLLGGDQAATEAAAAALWVPVAPPRGP